MPFSPEEIESKQFRVSLRGYSKEEVDGFLRQVAEDHQAMLAAIGSSRGDLMPRSPAAGDLDDDLTLEAPSLTDGGFDMLGHELGKLLRMAGESADALRQKIEREAAETRSGAVDEAKQLREEAVRSSHEIVAEAERRALEIRVNAERTANELILAAKNEASEARVHADQEAQERVRQAEARLEQLQEKEAKLRQRLHQLETVFQSIGEELTGATRAGLKTPAEPEAEEAAAPDDLPREERKTA